MAESDRRRRIVYYYRTALRKGIRFRSERQFVTLYMWSKGKLFLRVYKRWVGGGGYKGNRN